MMIQQVVSANRLTDGLVVYLTPQGGWSELLADGHIATDEATAQSIQDLAQQAVGDRIVVDPYLIDVAEFDGELRPKKYREYIRAMGPSIRTDLGKQAGQ
jgi:hypothetical protein